MIFSMFLDYQTQFIILNLTITKIIPKNVYFLKPKGNFKNLGKILKHFATMFKGIKYFLLKLKLLFS